MSHSKNKGYPLHYIGVVRTNIVLLVVLMVVLVILQPTFLTRKLASAQTGMVGGFSHLSIIRHNPLWWNIVVGVIQLVIFFLLKCCLW